MRQTRSRLSRSPAELRERAAEFQQMARHARPVQVSGALQRIAHRYEALADERERRQKEHDQVDVEAMYPTA
jgi:hypothetical protein